MRTYSSNRAIFILESPWELDRGDSNRSSVLPFIEGIAKLAGDTEVYHANFYDKTSFNMALDCLCKRKYKNTIVYVAAHGYKDKIGNVNISNVLHMIGEKSIECNITGVILGSCFVGNHTTTMEAHLEGTNLKWCAGYSSTSSWLVGTMVDCAIIAKMSQFDSPDFFDENLIVQSLANAISPFAGGFEIGRSYAENPVKLENSLQFVIQPSGQGRRAKKITDKVLANRVQ